MNSITKDDFLKMVRLQHLEVITQSQLHNNTQIIRSYMEKSLVSELSDIEKSDANMMIEEVGSLQKWEVMRDDFTKAICYTRREQVDWEDAERGEFGELIKAKGGVYKPTSENKKLGRVGQKYGESKNSDNSQGFGGGDTGTEDDGSGKKQDEDFKNKTGLFRPRDGEKKEEGGEKEQNESPDEIRRKYKSQQDYVNQFREQNKPIPPFAKEELDKLLGKVQKLDSKK
jgi:hypothetical protein